MSKRKRAAPRGLRRIAAACRGAARFPAGDLFGSGRQKIFQQKQRQTAQGLPLSLFYRRKRLSVLPGRVKAFSHPILNEAGNTEVNLPRPKALPRTESACLRAGGLRLPDAIKRKKQEQGETGSGQGNKSRAIRFWRSTGSKPRGDPYRIAFLVFAHAASKIVGFDRPASQSRRPGVFCCSLKRESTRPAARGCAHTLRDRF